jgi:hypothetical protein
MDVLLLAVKWACVGNAIFMLLWMGYRMAADHPPAWILLDAGIVVASIMVAWRYHEQENEY